LNQLWGKPGGLIADEYQDLKNQDQKHDGNLCGIADPQEQDHHRHEDDLGNWIEQVDEGRNETVQYLRPADGQPRRRRDQHRQNHPRRHSPQAHPKMDEQVLTQLAKKDAQHLQRLRQNG
jgi:hypothetical protein